MNKLPAKLLAKYQDQCKMCGDGQQEKLLRVFKCVFQFVTASAGEGTSFSAGENQAVAPPLQPLLDQLSRLERHCLDADGVCVRESNRDRERETHTERERERQRERGRERR